MYAVNQVHGAELEMKGRALAILFRGISTPEEAEKKLNSFTAAMAEGIKTLAAQEEEEE